jgi:hypothetical protein
MGLHLARGLHTLAWPSGKFGQAGPCQRASRRSPKGRSPHPGRPRWRGCCGSPTMGPRRGLHREHGEGSGVASGKVAEGGAHPGRLSTTRWREGATAAMLIDGDRAPVNFGGRHRVPQLRGVEEGVRERSIDQKEAWKRRSGRIWHGSSNSGGRS